MQKSNSRSRRETRAGSTSKRAPASGARGPDGRFDLNLVRTFVAVHARGSFSGAAAALGVPRSTVSRAVAALEEALALRLFQRTTRRVSTTDAGIALYDRVAPTLSTLEASLADVPEQAEEPSGTLRLTATADVGRIFLAEVVARFVARYPAVTVDMDLNNTMVDMVRDRFDLAVRLSGKTLRDSTLVARRAGAITFQLFASPAYLARAGAPRALGDLVHHETVAFRDATLTRVLRSRYTALMRQVGALVEGRVRATCDDMFFARELLRNGVGIGGLPSFVAATDVAAGRLVRVLPSVAMTAAQAYVVHPSRKHVPARVSVFREMLLETFRRKPL